MCLFTSISGASDVIAGADGAQNDFKHIRGVCFDASAGGSVIFTADDLVLRLKNGW